MLLLCSCGGGSHYRIGVSQPSSDAWRSQMNDEIRREILFHDDAEVEIRSADDDNETQIADIRHFMEQGFDLIIVSPNEGEALSPVLAEAYGKGIPVIVFDRAVKGDSYTSYLKLNNEELGRAAADYALDKGNGGKGGILEIRGLDGSSPAEERHRGFMERLGREGNGTGAPLASVNGKWNEEEARRLTDSLLDLHPQANIIYAHNDAMAIGASKAARACGRDDITILGIDATPSLGVQAVADSAIDATFVYPTAGDRVVRTALAILRGEPYPRIDRVGSTTLVDSHNAPILLAQNQLLADKTRQLEELNGKLSEMRGEHRLQGYFLYAVVVIALLLGGGTVLMVRNIRERRRYEKILREKNGELAAERDRQESLNAELEKERDRQRELYAELEEATRSKLAFFTNVSHDLRTPLALIAEPVEQVSKATYLEPSHRTLMQLANRNVGILRRMIEQILDFRKHQGGRLDLQPETVDLSGIVREWTESFAMLASKRRMKLTIDIPDSPAMVSVDLEKMERVFFNLLSNAFKYTPDGGTITVSVQTEKDRVLLRVSDNGSGIAPDDLDHIFERFYQARKVRPRGSGIGLALTKAFVERMGGSVSVESGKDRGSCFTVSLPMASDREQAADKAATELPVAAPVRTAAPHTELRELLLPEPEAIKEGDLRFDDDKPLLLMVDDNADIRRLVRELLGADHNIIEAADGKAALRLAMKYVPDIVVSDVMMPGMDGLELTRQLKQEKGTSHIPVLLLTACRLEEQRVAGFLSGADSYISKPFGGELLRVRVRNLIENRQRIHNLYLDCENPLAEIAARRSELPELNSQEAVENDFYRDFLKVVVERHADSDLAVGHIAAALGMTAGVLGRKVKALTGMAPTDVLRKVRMNQARLLLTTTDKSISEISYEVGFSSPQYFARCFRETFGQTASAFRESRR